MVWYQTIKINYNQLFLSSITQKNTYTYISFNGPSHIETRILLMTRRENNLIIKFFIQYLKTLFNIGTLNIFWNNYVLKKNVFYLDTKFLVLSLIERLGDFFSMRYISLEQTFAFSSIKLFSTLFSLHI